MRWILLNTFGTLSWLLGLFCAKPGTSAAQALLMPDAYRPTVGIALCAVGLTVLVRSNAID